MCRTRKIPFVLLILMLAFSVFCGIITKNSMSDNLSPRPYIDDEYIFCSIPDMNQNYMSNTSIRSYSDLMDASDLVVRLEVSNENERYFHTNQTVTEANVLEVYKGTSDEQIYILEPIVYENGCIISTEGYYWLRDNEEYVFFLKQFDDVHIGKDNKIYIPTSAGYGQYCLSNEYEIEYSNDDLYFDRTKYRRIRDQIRELF